MPIKSYLARLTARRGGHTHRNHAAARVVIKKPVSWQKRLFWGALLTLTTVLTGVGLFIGGQYSVGYNSFDVTRRIASLTQENSDLRAHNEELSDALKTATTQLHIEQGARRSMEGQILRLEDERNRLNRDLALFDNLFPTAGAEGRPIIRGFRIEPAGGSWRYRILIMRPGRSQDTFSGNLQIQVRYRQDGRDILATTPETGKISERLQFQRYQRVEGHFQAPDGAKLLGAVARVMENDRLVSESIYKP
ncbi:MAG: hypothetical protein PHS77_09240 [Gallionellaceae bacterium]|nr:hypothetical protein [Gallionellaceae bacterium]